MACHGLLCRARVFGSGCPVFRLFSRAVPHIPRLSWIRRSTLPRARVGVSLIVNQTSTFFNRCGADVRFCKAARAARMPAFASRIGENEGGGIPGDRVLPHPLPLVSEK